jgi:hypothetical protein
MELPHRHKYLSSRFDRMHDKLNDAFEEVYEGDFECCRNTINSLIYDLRQIKKSMEP